MNYSQFDILTFFMFLLLFWMCFWGIAKLLKLEKRGWDVGPGFFMAKTTRLNRLINKLAKRFPRFWRVLWTIGIGFGFGAMIFTMAWLGVNLYALITAPQPENAIVPLIPGVTVTGLPLLYMILPIAIIMFCHEIAHGIAARIDGVTVKSSGFLAFLILFGAFVELDEEQVAKKSRRTRQRIFVAGSFVNLIISLFSLILITNMYRIGDGAYLYDVLEEGPSFGFLRPNEVIIEVNGTQIRDYLHLSEVLDQFKPFDPVLFTVKAEDGSITDRIIFPEFNRSATYTPWGFRLINNGTIIGGDLDNLSANDQNRFSLNASNNYLNFSLLLNITTFGLFAENLTWLFVDLEINASLNNFDTSKVYLTNFSSPTQNYEILSLQNLTSGVSITGNISKSAGYSLGDYVNGSNFIELNFVFNDSSDFSVGIDLCKFYMLTNQSNSYFGIITTINLEDRALAFILGPLAPHVYQMLTYLFMFSLAVGLINLLPIPPFDGDHLFVSLFEKVKPNSNSTESSKEEANNGSKDEEAKPKEPWTWRKTLIWSVRILAIFLFLSNIILSIMLFDIFTIFSGIF